MAKKATLRELSKRWPAAPELKKALDDARKDSDRSAAIIGSALLDGVLERYIAKKLKRQDKATRDVLFEDRGPLSDFYSKIVVAKAFGVISSTMAEEMQRVRRIRNVFAHAVVEVSFDTPQIAQECRDFIMLKAMIAAGEKNGMRNEERPIFDNNKFVYLLMIELLCIMLSYEHAARAGEELFGQGPVSYGAPSDSS